MDRPPSASVQWCLKCFGAPFIWAPTPVSAMKNLTGQVWQQDGKDRRWAGVWAKVLVVFKHLQSPKHGTSSFPCLGICPLSAFLQPYHVFPLLYEQLLTGGTVSLNCFESCNLLGTSWGAFLYRWCIEWLITVQNVSTAPMVMCVCVCLFAQPCFSCSHFPVS